MQRGENEIEKICGVLHDIVEDTDWTFDALEKEGFSKEIIDVLKLVTKTSEDEDYDAFIKRVSINPIAVKVKLNDLQWDALHQNVYRTHHDFDFCTADEIIIRTSVCVMPVVRV